MKRKDDHLKLVKKGSAVPAWKKVTRFILRLVLVLGLLVMLKQGEAFFRINEVKVEGADELQTGEVLNAGEISKGMSIFLLQDRKVKERIQGQLPRVKKVEISRDLPDTVAISVKERKPAAYVMTADGFWLIDKDAVPFAYAEEPTQDYPLISGIDGSLVIPGDPLDCSGRRGVLQSFFSVWPGESSLEIDKMELSESYNLVVHTTDDLEVWFGDGEDMDDKLKLIEQGIPYIDPGADTRLDVRCGNRLVVSSSAVIKGKEVSP